MSYAHSAHPWARRGRLAFSDQSEPGSPGPRCHKGGGPGGSQGGPRGRHGFGPGGPGGGPGGGYGSGPGRFGPSGPGGRFAGGGRGRRRRGDVRLALLMLLAEEPRNGYGLMQAIDERSAGRWRPSPGSVYPTLAQLEDEGLIHAIEQDGGKLFELTDEGREHLAESVPGTAPWDRGQSEGDDARHELHALTRQVIMAVRQVVHAGEPPQLERARTTLAETRRALYLILADEGVTKADDAAPEPSDDAAQEPSEDTGQTEA